MRMSDVDMVATTRRTSLVSRDVTFIHSFVVRGLDFDFDFDFVFDFDFDLDFEFEWT